MFIESALTTFLKYKFAKTLQFDQFARIVPPKPMAGKTYLLYVHIPFCEELCPYCSFNRFAFQKDIAKKYFAGLHREIEKYSELGFDFKSIYVGGGTPTVLPKEMADFLITAQRLFTIQEISLETNPNHLTAEIMDLMKSAGVNRLSVGVQSFNDGLLQQMERYHKYGSGEEIKKRLADLMGTFDTLNVDMIFNFPTQTMQMLEHDIRVIQEIHADQVTFYPLMVSDITKRELATRFGPINYEQEKAFYYRISDLLAGDYVNGTAWCFSKKKRMIDEYIVDYDEYIGVGSGSFGYANGACFANTFSIEDYLNALDKNQFPIFARKDFNFKDQIHYDFMMKLFSTSMPLDYMEAKFNNSFKKTLWKELPIFQLIGAFTNKNGKIQLTKRGKYLWVIMMREFFTGVNNFRDACRKSIMASNML
jgi:menaquinone C8-methyltransferase